MPQTLGNAHKEKKSVFPAAATAKKPSAKMKEKEKFFAFLLRNIS